MEGAPGEGELEEPDRLARLTPQGHLGDVNLAAATGGARSEGRLHDRRRRLALTQPARVGVIENPPVAVGDAGAGDFRGQFQHLGQKAIHAGESAQGLAELQSGFDFLLQAFGRHLVS